MKLDKLIKGWFVKMTLPMLRHEKIIKQVPRELVQFCFYRKGYLEFFPDNSLMERIAISPNPVRYAMLVLAIRRVHEEKVPGSFAEVGVYRGDTSKIICENAQGRPLFLFDTFSGFGDQDGGKTDDRFRDATIELLKQRLGGMRNVFIRAGYFPETAQGLENERFAFVMLDVDKFKPTLAGLEFFYPRLASGGYLFAHDYNSAESDWAVSRAFKEFMADKPEKIIDIPDTGGSVVFRKI